MRRNVLRELVNFFDDPSHSFNNAEDTASVQQREMLINPGITGNENIDYDLEPFTAEQGYTPRCFLFFGGGGGERGGLHTFMGYFEPP